MPMNPLLRRVLNRRHLCEGIAISIAITMLTIMFTRLSHTHGLMLANGQPLYGDFIAFWSAGKMALQGHADLVHDRAAIQGVQLSTIVGMHVMAPWNSPPTFLLLCVPLALLPYPVAALTFLGISAALYFFVAYKLLPDKRSMLFAATLPAALYHPGNVQVGLLIAGVSGLAIHCLDKRPRVAGALVALLAIKPHLALLWPVLLLISRRWVAFATAAIATTAFALTAGLVFGIQTYVHFVENLKRSADLITHMQVGAQTFGSLYGNLLGLGVAQPVASIVHGISALSAVLIAAWVFWRGDRITQGAALCAATMLISPYLFFYDFTLLAVAAALMSPPRNRVEFFAVALAWLSALSVAVGVYKTLPICPSAAWLMLIVALRRTGSAALVPAPAPQP